MTTRQTQEPMFTEGATIEAANVRPDDIVRVGGIKRTVANACRTTTGKVLIAFNDERPWVCCPAGRIFEHVGYAR